MSRSSVLRPAVLAASILSASLPGVSHAAINSFIGEIMWTGATFCPVGWADADGQVLPISEFEALFSLIGTTYGGDGQTTFALPDLRGRSMVHVGQGPGLAPMQLGQMAGAEVVTLTAQNIPGHTHTATTTLSGLQVTSTLRGSTATNNAASPAGAALGVSKKPGVDYVAATPNADMALGSVQSSVTGGTATTTIDATNSGTAPVSVRNPYLAMRACISLYGIFPVRN